MVQTELAKRGAWLEKVGEVCDMVRQACDAVVRFEDIREGRPAEGDT